MKKALYISGSLGLGHAVRDIAIARELSDGYPDISVEWLAAEPAATLIKQAGGKVIPEVAHYANDNETAEGLASGANVNLMRYAFGSLKSWERNVNVLKKVLDREEFDVIIGDETYEIAVALLRKRLTLKVPFVMIYDFVGLDPMSRNPIEAIGVYFWNRTWSRDRTVVHQGRNCALFIGEMEDVPDKSFGLFLPNRRAHAREHYQFVGYILPFDPRDYQDKSMIRQKLGYSDKPLVFCSIGGTAIGKSLLELCGQTYPVLKKQIPDIRMILVCGPRLDPSCLHIPEGVETRGFVPNLYEHFAASDIAVVQAGGTTTLELTALRVPFIYFPLEGHSEQQIMVSGRLQRHQAGLRMSYIESTPESLAKTIKDNIGRPVRFRNIPVDGARKAADLIAQCV